MKKYNVIYADPPWSYENTSLKADDAGKEISIEGRYDLMTLEQLTKMPIREITEKDSVCFMWATNPMLPEAILLLKAWGFKYKTMLTWKKTTCSGYWFMGITEHILFGVRGDVKAFRSGLLNFHACKSGGHSQKPDYFRQLISKAVEKSFAPPLSWNYLPDPGPGFTLITSTKDGTFTEMKLITA